jgi:hypothetical protein
VRIFSIRCWKNPSKDAKPIVDTVNYSRPQCRVVKAIFQQSWGRIGCWKNPFVMLRDEKITPPPMAYRTSSCRGRGYTSGKSLRLIQRRLTTTRGLPLFQTIKIGEATMDRPPRGTFLIRPAYVRGSRIESIAIRSQQERR